MNTIRAPRVGNEGSSRECGGITARKWSRCENECAFGKAILICKEVPRKGAKTQRRTSFSGREDFGRVEIVPVAMGNGEQVAGRQEDGGGAGMSSAWDGLAVSQER